MSAGAHASALAWRHWGVANLGPRGVPTLVEAVHPDWADRWANTVWATPRMRARCRLAGHQPPDRSCGCGLLSVGSLWTLMDLLIARPPAGFHLPDDFPLAVGLVRLCGAVVPAAGQPPGTVLSACQEVAGPLFLSPAASVPGTCRFLEQHYGVEVLDGPGPVDDAGGWQAWLFNVIAQRGERCPFDETTSEAGTPADASKAWQLEELLNVMEDVGIPLDE
jgi:hypothetical protein